MQPTPTPEDKKFFNDNTVFMFYSKSSNKKPGMEKEKYPR